MRKQLKDHGAEKRALKKIGARPQPASGATPGMPNDGVKGKYLIEVKSTQKKSIRLQLEDLQKLADNALMHGKSAALIIAFEREDEGTWYHEWWVATPLFDFEKLSLEWRTR